jgi:hypothetical protein
VKQTFFEQTEGNTSAAFEMNSEQTDFPIDCPWSWEQIMDDEFYPG